LRTEKFVTENKDMLEWIAAGNDIWDGAAANLPFRQQALLFAALPSSQHHVERLVKRGAECAKTKKGKHKQSIYATAGNGFLTEQHNKDGCVTSEADNDAEEDEDQDDKRRRGHFRGPNRIYNLFEQVEKKSRQLQEIEIKLGVEACAAKRLTISNAMKPDNALTETRRQLKIASVTGGFEVDKAPNAKQRLVGYDVQPRVVGKVQITKLTKDKHLESINTELAARVIFFNDAHSITDKKALLIADENKRWLVENPDGSATFDRKFFAPISDAIFYD
jgi:hypothetical protein